VHFGLGDQATIEQVIVRWPTGEVERFSGLEARNRYLLVQESGTARRLPLRRPSVPLAAALSVRTPSGGVTSKSDGGSIRLVPHRELPLPKLRFLDFQGDLADVFPAKERCVLLSLWASWCAPCVVELRELAKSESRLIGADVRWLPISVDQYQQDTAVRLSAATQFLSAAGLPLRGGLGTAESVEVLDVVPRVLVTKQDPLALPCSFLLNSQGSLIAVYKGAISSQQVVRDADELTRRTGDPRDKGVPLPGRWLTLPFPPDLLAIPYKLVEIGRAEAALEYLETHVSADQYSPALTADNLASLYAQVGRQLAEQRQFERALIAFQRTVSLQPELSATRASLAEMYQRQGRIAEAVAEHEKVLEQDPDNLVSANNLGWILATSPDPAIRNPQEALRRAEQACRVTEHRFPPALDTLAAAQAAAGRYQEAVETAAKAVELVQSAGMAAAADRIQKRLELYQSGQPYVEPSASQTDPKR
jgi:Flp pilus assembly protein TadD/thiol-disulfide isomerase/thioredoxin